ncbi:hypothetical protein QUF90_20255 [Desulfococcaceae bacterium HSG9]|nr:hypothetical protein [Desulfococcaceae bacterium HSG9]
MKNHKHSTLLLKLNKKQFSSFFPILQKGFMVKALTGSSIKNLLCEQYKVKTDYLTERIKTIFLDGQPVDDVETASVKDGSTLALAAAMPGLVGATFRTGGVLSSFRSGITYKGEEMATDSHEKGTVKIKLFNLVTGELGPLFLKQGVWLKKEDIKLLLQDSADILRPLISYAEKDSQAMVPEQIAVLNWSEEPEDVHLRVLV